MKRMAFFLKKGNKKMSRFYPSQLELQEDYKDTLVLDGYSVGVMKFSHTEEATERKFVTFYVDSWNHYCMKNKKSAFYGEAEGGKIPEVGDFIMKAQERDVFPFANSRVQISKRKRVEIIGKVTLEMVLKMREEQKVRLDALLDKATQENGRLLCYTSYSGQALFNEQYTFNAELQQRNAMNTRVAFTVDRDAVRIINESSGLIEVEDIDSVKFL